MAGLTWQNTAGSNVNIHSKVSTWHSLFLAIRCVTLSTVVLIVLVLSYGKQLIFSFALLGPWYTKLATDLRRTYDRKWPLLALTRTGVASWSSCISEVSKTNSLEHHYLQRSYRAVRPARLLAPLIAKNCICAVSMHRKVYSIKMST